MNVDRLYSESLRGHEGLRLKPYKDSKGFWTIGIGDLIDKKQMSFREAIHLWNNGITESAAIERCKQNILRAHVHAREVLGSEYYDDLSEVRQEVLTEMVFQMGAHGVSLFKKTIAFIRVGEHRNASVEMLDSKWHREDSPGRAETLAARYRNNAYYPASIVSNH